MKRFFSVIGLLVIYGIIFLGFAWAVSACSASARTQPPATAGERAEAPSAPSPTEILEDAVASETELPVVWIRLAIPHQWVVIAVESRRVTLSDGIDAAIIRLDEERMVVDWSVSYQRLHEDGSWLECVVARSDPLSGTTVGEPEARLVELNPAALQVNWPLSEMTQREFIRTLERLEGGICF